MRRILHYSDVTTTHAGNHQRSQGHSSGLRHVSYRVYHTKQPGIKSGSYRLLRQFFQTFYKFPGLFEMNAIPAVKTHNL